MVIEKVRAAAFGPIMGVFMLMFMFLSFAGGASDPMVWIIGLAAGITILVLCAVVEKIDHGYRKRLGTSAAAP